jgi:hypothetical protein
MDRGEGMRCDICGFRIRGKKHNEGFNHKTRVRISRVPKKYISLDGNTQKRTREFK